MGFGRIRIEDSKYELYQKLFIVKKSLFGYRVTETSITEIFGCYYLIPHNLEPPQIKFEYRTPCGVFRNFDIDSNYGPAFTTADKAYQYIEDKKNKKKYHYSQKISHK